MITNAKENLELLSITT
ncbi:unnamed protein product, partial [Allacma fusca]